MAERVELQLVGGQVVLVLKLAVVGTFKVHYLSGSKLIGDSDS